MKSLPARAGVAVAGLACVLGLAACTGEEEKPEDEAPVVQLGAPGESGRPLSDEEIAELESATAHTDADVSFVQNMIPHHGQALVMTAFVPQRSQSRDLALLAKRIEVAQRDEIGQMETWLETRGEKTGHDHDDHDHSLMPGMLTEKQLARLQHARGNKFDRLFLRSMIAHHQGALLMVGELFAAGGGQEPTVFQLAQHIDADQRVEIARMRSMLAEL
jgi:uncharacterized protein (DUF305 family)